MAKKDSAIGVSIPKPNRKAIDVLLIGDTPLIAHRWAEKARKEIADKQGKRGSKAKGKRDPEAEYEAAKYKTHDGKDGFVARGIKQAMVNACRFIDGFPMTVARGAFFVLGDVLPLKYEDVRMREDPVRLSGRGGTADLRYRPEYVGWKLLITVTFDADVISAEQIISLLEKAGFSVGLGDWRPEKNGSNGRFHVDNGESR